MANTKFNKTRRQQFLTEEYFKLNKIWLAILIRENGNIEQSGLTSTDPSYAGVFGSTFKECLSNLKLHYTAGWTIGELIPLYKETINALIEWHKAYNEYISHLETNEEAPTKKNSSPCYFEDLHHYQLVIEMTSLGILLGQSDAILKIAKLLASYRGSDLLFETLLNPVTHDNLCESGEFFHLAPYDPLLDAIYVAETATEASEKVKEYLEGWYKAFEGVPWHNGHLYPADHQIPYYGYWSFEAAAICLIHDIDDSSFRDHMVYPKDLIEWAKINVSIGKLSTGTLGAEQLRCEAGQPCPQAGYWFTPAKADSRRAFKQGDIMPAVDSAYGATIWQWDADQQN